MSLPKGFLRRKEIVTIYIVALKYKVLLNPPLEGEVPI